MSGTQGLEGWSWIFVCVPFLNQALNDESAIDALLRSLDLGGHSHSGSGYTVSILAPWL